MASSGVAGPNAGLLWGWLDGESGWGLGGFNPNMAMLDALLMPAVLSAALTAPPGGPAAGDRYIVAAAPTGAWAGHAGELAVYRGGAWVFYPPKTGYRAFNVATGLHMTYSSGAWASAANSEPVPAPATHAYQMLRANAAGTALEYIDRPFEGSVIVGAAPSASEVLLRHKMAGAVRFAAGLPGWQFEGVTNATASTTFALAKNGATFGTLTIAAGSVTPTFTAGIAADFAAGDVLTITAPATPDATLANFSITVYGTRR